MSKSSRSRKKKKKSRSRSSGSSTSGSGGMLMNMRGGFKKGARVVAGEESMPAWLDWTLTIVLLALAAYVLYSRFFS